MKRVLASLLFCLSLSACSSKQDDPAASTLVGTWTGVSVRFKAEYSSPSNHNYDYTQPLTGNTLTLTADHQVTQVTPLSGTTTGTYTYKAPTLTLSFPAYNTELKVVELTEASLTSVETHQDPSGTFTTTITRSR